MCFWRLKPQKRKQLRGSSFLIPPRRNHNTPRVLAISGIEDPEISVGDVVFYKNFSGTELEFDGKEYLMMPYADILGRIVETDKI